jgi:AcrR family transcriptional regulator
MAVDDSSNAPGDRRAQVLAVALELLSEQGYAATTISQIAERTSVTPPALYYHFDSKEQLVRELVDPHLGELETLVANSGSPRRDELLQRYAEVVIDSPAVARFLDRDAAGLTQIGISQRHDAVDAEVVRALAGPEASEADLTAATAAVGAVRRVVTNDGDRDPARVAERVIRVF